MYPTHSVVPFGGCDYWGTWFIEECEREGLFGATARHLVTLERYTIGTKIFLEDSPYFHQSRTKHRICGPYEVVQAEPLPDGCVPVLADSGATVVFRDQHPENGPWANHSRVQRVANGVNLRYRQMASSFGFFPFRFRIRRLPNRHPRLEPHSSVDCRFGW